jgi:dienelactone hydrolase
MKISSSTFRILLPAGWVLAALAASAAEAPTAPAITTLTVVDYQQQDSPLSGPFAVVVEHDPGLATHTIYRPRDMGNSKRGVLVWGEGGCAKNGLTFPEFLSEIASHGFVIVADGPPVQRTGGARAGGGAPAGLGNMTDGTALLQAINWLEKESKDSKSRFYNKVEMKKVAAMGMSCGGLMSYGAAGDPRVTSVGIWNSGLREPDQKLLDSVHGSVIIITGGESDMAFPNGKRDFETLPKNLPVFYGVYPSIGHGGTYNQDNGGPFGKVAVAWLKWQLLGDNSTTAKGYFVGKDCLLCKDSTWQVQSRGLK